VLEALLDVLAPPHCVGCGAFATVLCPACVAAIARPPIVRNGIYGIGRATALGAYDGTLRRAILALKYSNAVATGWALGELLAGCVARAADALVPVPLHGSRLRKRGYNQAEALACGMLRGWPPHREPPRVVADALSRSRATAPQSGLDHAAREENVALAFQPGPGILAVAGKRVVLIDDVLTTGATLRACAIVLRESGAATVDACCAAIKL
jgi:ComF family protein